MLLYLGPEVLMPLASVFAAIGGVLLMFWNKIRSGLRALFGRGSVQADVIVEPERDTRAP